MYKKTADLHHLHERTASHATKGSGRGTVWWNVHDPANFDPRAVKRELRLRRAFIGRQYNSAMIEFKQILEMNKDAVLHRDQAMILTLRPSIRAFSKNLRKIKKEMDELEQQMRTLPKIPPKVKSIKRHIRLLTKQNIPDNENPSS